MKEYQLFILELYFPPINHHRKRGGEKAAKAGKWEREESPGQQPEREFNPAPIEHCRVLQEHREPRAGGCSTWNSTWLLPLFLKSN